MIVRYIGEQWLKPQGQLYSMSAAIPVLNSITTMNIANAKPRLRQRWFIWIQPLAVCAALLPSLAIAQGTLPGGSTPVPVTPAAAPTFWYLLAAALAMLVPVGLVLIGVAGLEPQRAWQSALGAVGAIGLSGLAYWAVGFGLQFGGVGLGYVRPDLRNLVLGMEPAAGRMGCGLGCGRSQRLVSLRQ